MPAQSSTAGAQRPAAIEIRFGQIGLIQLQLRTTDPDSILEHLAERMASAPRFFEHMAVGLDITTLPQPPGTEDMRAVLEAVRQAGLVSVGLISGAAGLESLAGELSLPVLGSLQGLPSPTAPATAPIAQVVPPPAPPPPANEAAPAPPPPAAPTVHPAPAGKDPPLYQLRPVRSGQRIYARNRDLIVLSQVGSGAEVIADGNVHVYGTLRGRAGAGARGDRAARVFCTDFRAELISIAGVFRIFETFPDGLEGSPVHVWLYKDELRVARIGAPPAITVPPPPPGDAR
jgi:septum site-determining protein MinC